MLRLSLVVGLVLCMCSDTHAQRRRGRIQPVYTSQPSQVSVSQQVVESNATALDEVNKARAERGLKPFIHDPLLSVAAFEAATQRCKRGLHGHLENDFGCLPKGGHATAAGCGALEPSWGWGSCCTYDSYTHAGAAWVKGSDGLRYMHLFVR